MIDTEKGAGVGDAVGCSDKNKEREKKKRSRVKQLLTDVKKQVEFWFGDVNLHKDRFLRKLVDESDDGYVDISILASFNRMKNLTADAKLIARALKNSSVVEVNFEGNKVRRILPIGDPPNDEDSRTVYVELLPKDVTHNWIERVFSKCGNVVYVSIPKYKSTGDSKGFAFIEFEKVDQAQKAIEMLNNPPEDAPRKPGIFPKTLSGKTIPMPPENPTSGEEEEKKKRKKKKKKSSTSLQNSVNESKEQPMEAESTVQKRKSESEVGTAQPKTPSKEKKRRRSQTVDASEGELPPKMRKTSGSGTGEDSSKSSRLAKNNEKGEIKDEKENLDDSGIKAKRKRKKMHKEKLKIGEEVIPLRVLPKKAWLELKQEYLMLQKRSMAALKKSMTKIDPKNQQGQKDIQQEQREEKELQAERRDENVSMEERNEKTAKQGPQFVSGVILKITDNKPLPGRKKIKEVLSKISPVAYIDTTEGDAEAHVRFYTPEETKAVNAVKVELQKEHNWKMEILSGDHEQRYWQKILVDRQVKLNRPREKKRGTEKLISKAEKIIMARAKEANKHIRFDD